MLLTHDCPAVNPLRFSSIFVNISSFFYSTSDQFFNGRCHTNFTIMLMKMSKFCRSRAIIKHDPPLHPTFAIEQHLPYIGISLDLQILPVLSNVGSYFEHSNRSSRGRMSGCNFSSYD